MGSLDIEVGSHRVKSSKTGKIYAAGAPALGRVLNVALFTSLLEHSVIIASDIVRRAEAAP